MQNILLFSAISTYDMQAKSKFSFPLRNIHRFEIILRYKDDQNKVLYLGTHLLQILLRALAINSMFMDTHYCLVLSFIPRTSIPFCMQMVLTSKAPSPYAL